MSAPVTPGGVLRRSLILWGLGDLAMGRTDTGVTWIAVEIAALATLLGSLLWLTETTLYLVPYLLGSAFIAVWAAQAVAAYRRAWRREQAIGPTPAHSPAGAIVWLSLPLLVWSTAFWLLAAGAATPGAVLDRFMAAWSAQPGPERWTERLTTDPSQLGTAADAALVRLEERCRELGAACDPDQLLRDVRVTIISGDEERATAAVDAVRFVREPTRVLGLFPGSELVPTPDERLLTLELATVVEPGPAGLDLGARRWVIVDSQPGDAQAEATGNGA